MSLTAIEKARLIDAVTNAVDEWVRAGAGTYDELQAVVEAAIDSALSPSPLADQPKEQPKP